MKRTHVQIARQTLLAAATALAMQGRIAYGQNPAAAPSPASSPGATNATAAAVILPETVVTASRVSRDVQSEPSATRRIDAADGTTRAAKRTTAGLLEGAPSVMVQKTSYGQNSPYLRGMTGYRTLCLVDGIRLNNSAFRSGPNQYWSTIDPLSLDHCELVMGPGSVLYGSDAIGGTLNAISADAPAWTGEPAWERGVYFRGASAENSNVERLELGARLSEQLGFVGGYSLKDFGDLEGGADVGEQEHTGYDEQDFDGKLNYYLDADSTLTLSHQSVRQDDAWRTHRTIYGIDWEGLAKGSDKVTSYDQSRDLTYLRYRAENLDGLVNGTEITLSRHAQGEDLYRVKKDDKIERSGFDVETWGGALQLESDGGFGQWVYGADYYHDIVDSYSRQYSAADALEKEDIQGPLADDATYDLSGVFAQDTISCLDGRLDVIPGARYTIAEADADKVKDPVTGKATTFSDDWEAAVASLRLLVPITEDRRHVAYGDIAQGFRAPSLSDVTRFDIARSNEIEIPSPDLDPEEYVTYEVGFKSHIERLVSRLSYYYTTIDSMIVRTPNGNVTPDGLIEVTKMNSGDGYIHGVELEESFRLNAQWLTWMNATWQEGKVDAYPTSLAAEKEREYISRMMPPTAQIGVRWQTPAGKYWTEVVGDLADKADKLSTEDKLDTQRIPPGGTPGYAVGTVRTGARVAHGVDLALAVENVLDDDYRIHGSGVNEPGRNVVVTAHWAF